MTDKNEYTIIGIDGGGTHTRGALYRGGELISEAKSGTTRIGAVGVGESCERTLHVILELCNRAEIETTELDAVVVGLAGVWLNEEKRRSAQLLKTLARSQSLVLNDVLVTSDAEIALEGAFEGGSGIIVIVGTGSIALGKAGKDKLSRCGGWGIELDDEGSGAWIGREGLTAVVRALDGRGNPTILTEQIEKLYPTININEPRTIVKAYSERAFEYHMLTPSVMEAAKSGDVICLDIIKRAATHLAELPSTLQKQFKQPVVPVALMGGIIDAKTILADMLKEQVESMKGLKLVEPKGNAIDGAIAIGQRLIFEME